MAMLARVEVPRQARRGEVVKIRIAIRHPMETGFRHDDEGHLIPKNVINRLTCRYGGEEIFSADLGSGIAANPYFEFYTVALASGDLEFSWQDDAGESGAERAQLIVTE
jgi:sulfur-oxidizing protein SoxZ